MSVAFALYYEDVRSLLLDRGLLRWILEVGSKAAAGENIPNVETDQESYIEWLETYNTVQSVLHKALGTMLPVVLADSRYKALSQHCRTLDRIALIRQIFDDYDLASHTFEMYCQCSLPLSLMVSMIWMLRMKNGVLVQDI